jgi:hypothetical protein
VLPMDAPWWCIIPVDYDMPPGSCLLVSAWTEKEAREKCEREISVIMPEEQWVASMPTRHARSVPSRRRKCIPESETFHACNAPAVSTR